MGYALPNLDLTFKFSVAAQSALGVSARSNLVSINYNEEKEVVRNYCYTDGDLMKAIGQQPPSQAIDDQCLAIINKCMFFYGESLIDLNKDNAQGYVAMHFAAYFNYQKTLDRLIELDADLNAMASGGISPLYLTLTNSVK